jgi:mannonate dehydratase
MKIALMVTPMSDSHLRLAAQIGVEEIVSPFPGVGAGGLATECDRVRAFGMRISVVERHVPHDRLVHGLPGRDEQMTTFKDLVREMGRQGVETLCYNWMPEEDWQRTSIDTRERGEARVTAFDLDQVRGETRARPTPADHLWRNLQTFLEELLPVAEDAGVRLAMHPDDPPLPSLRGQDRIMTNFDAFERLLDLHPSPANGICYCQGSFASAGEDVLAGIHRLGERIHFVHFRDVRGTVPKFHETFQDNGPTDMAAAIRAYREIGFTGPLRPDHVPTLEGESNENPGYEMLGRLFAVGYIRGLLDAVPASIR